jgi:L-serine kinase (ADP)
VTLHPEFALVPLERLRCHERVQLDKVRELVAEMTRTSTQADPILVARDSWVILNGHHRAEALRRLGAKRVAAWLVDYDSDAVKVDRWRPGPPISKGEVVKRADEGRPFPPKTTRHRLAIELPLREVPLAELLD